MAKKGEQTIVIKKIFVIGGAHGGAWKVAFADFMTAMMCFFLVMWLLNQSDAVKKQIASYFSGPSMLEHDFSSFGAKLTLEKLFLDMVNEPLGTLQKMMQPVDFTPNVLSMGNQEIVLHQLAEDLGLVAKNVAITNNSIEFTIDDYLLFVVGTPSISSQFVDVMEKIRAVTTGLEDATVTIDSGIFVDTVPDKDISTAEKVALQRGYILKKYIESHLENNTVSVKVKTSVEKAKVLPASGMPAGAILFTIQENAKLEGGGKPREIQKSFSDAKIPDKVYEEVVKKVQSRNKNIKK